MNAIIMAAGFGSRMVPVTLKTPKPLVEVNGVRFIDTLIEAFQSKGIKEIYVVRGYKKEAFDVLKEKYPFIQFIDNDKYDSGNNILSLQKALPYLNDTYIAEADLFLRNPDLINPNCKESTYLARYVNSTDDWCFDIEGGRLINYRKGGSNCYMACGLSHWTPSDSKKIRIYLEEALVKKENKDIFWEFIPFVLNKDSFSVKPLDYKESDIIEVDSFKELCEIDPSYRSYQGE